MFNYAELRQVVALVVSETIKVLESKNLLGEQSPKTERTAYQKTEQLLYNYRGFQRIVRERMREIEDIRKYGVPQKSSGAMGERVQTSNTVHGIVLQEESVENAVQTIMNTVQTTVQALALIDKCMSALDNDPYYEILEMRYFEGRTQEDIADYFGCNQATIARNKSRLVKELSMQLFPDQVASEILN